MLPAVCRNFTQTFEQHAPCCLPERLARNLKPVGWRQQLLTRRTVERKSMNLAAYEVTELTFEEACAAAGGHCDLPPPDCGGEDPFDPFDPIDPCF
ncbi:MULTISPECIES: hypothetical protein [unclassified Bradyrhizobium]|uniref:hypothetical protein n=1 Tax=unclassified Bradyrhizobium TaxID=2631580 RepID=UPI002478491A|nr:MULTISPECIES: hypothetical protein [unclassified Bradyrhizobium]WGS19299.1 hypothetical protein MTX22_33570 [Bradyrhizobium sp. ISRA463]WGS26134.1 hypothetical protein MTX19_31080 [Bradyrhizobium sp. ISRA464]